MCPNKFFKKTTESPKFILDQANATSVLMGCGDDGSSRVLNGYYVSINGKEHNYLLSRELIGEASKSTISDIVLQNWQQSFSKFAVCNKGEFCAKLK